MDIVAERQGGRHRDRQAARHAREAPGAGGRADRGPARRGVRRPRRPRRPPRPRSQNARADKDTLLRELARPPPRARGRRRGAARRSRRRSRPSWPALGTGHGRPGQAGLGRADLARQRPDHVAVLRVARVGVLPPGHRHRRPVGHADPRRRGGQGRADAGRRRPRAATATSPASSTRGSLSTCYAHQSRFGTSMGAQVSQGQVIGYVGCTGRCFGDHLHFETRINGVRREPHELPLAQLQPEIDLFGLTIQTFGLCLGAAFLVAGWMVAKRLQRARPQRRLRLRDGLRRADRRDLSAPSSGTSPRTAGRCSPAPAWSSTAACSAARWPCCAWARLPRRARPAAARTSVAPSPGRGLRDRPRSAASWPATATTARTGTARGRWRTPTAPSRRRRPCTRRRSTRRS